MTRAAPYPEPEPFPSGVIEPGIAPLVDALNATRWLWTTGSCEGHVGLALGRRQRRPYVDFLADELIARTVHLSLRDALNIGQLHYLWRLTGLFLFHPGPGQMVLRLSWRLMSEGSARRWARRKMDADIHTLVAALPGPICRAGATGDLSFLIDG